MDTDDKGNIGSLATRYTDLRDEARRLRDAIDRLDSKRLGKWHMREILSLDGKLVKIARSVLDLQIETQIAYEKRKGDKTKNIGKDCEVLEVLVGNVGRLLESLLSLQRTNTHSYLLFSFYFSIAVAFSSLLVSVLSLSVSILSVVVSVRSAGAGRVTTDLIPVHAPGGDSMFLQVLLNGLVSASTYLLIAYSFSIIYSIRRVFYFTHGMILTAGAYSVLFAMSAFGLPVWSAIFAGVTAAALLGVVTNALVYSPLRSKGASSAVQMLASLGMYIILQNCISLAFDDYTRVIRPSRVREGIDIWGARVTIIQILTTVLGVLLPCSCWVVLKLTRVGLAMRAVASSPELSSVSGISCERMTIWAFFLGSGLAGVAGILIAWDVDMVPTMGMTPLLMGIVTLIVGGIQSLWGMALGALILSFSQCFGAVFVGSQWQTAIAFLVLLIFLLLKPEGILGKEFERATG